MSFPLRRNCSDSFQAPPFCYAPLRAKTESKIFLATRPLFEQRRETQRGLDPLSGTEIKLPKPTYGHRAKGAAGYREKQAETKPAPNPAPSAGAKSAAGSKSAPAPQSPNKDDDLGDLKDFLPLWMRMPPPGCPAPLPPQDFPWWLSWMKYVLQV